MSLHVCGCDIFGLDGKQKLPVDKAESAVAIEDALDDDVIDVALDTFHASKHISTTFYDSFAASYLEDGRQIFGSVLPRLPVNIQGSDLQLVDVLLVDIEDHTRSDAKR